MAQANNKVLRLTEEALRDLESEKPLAPLVEKAMRVARLLGDYRHLNRLSIETRMVNEKEAKKQVTAEVYQHLSPEETKKAHDAAVHDYLEERTITPLPGQMGEPKGYYQSVAELEMLVQLTGDVLNPESDSFADLAPTFHDEQLVLSRVRSRLYQYLSRVETICEIGQANEDIFSQNRTYIESRLASLSPKTLEALESAERRRRDDNPEERSQALASCRRALKHLADDLYPASETSVLGFDGELRKMTNDKYIQRLVQFAHENLPSETDRKLLVAQLDKLCAYMDALDDLANKGVHDFVESFEVNQCIIQTYLTVGDYLRLGDRDGMSPTHSRE